MQRGISIMLKLCSLLANNTMYKITCGLWETYCGDRLRKQPAVRWGTMNRVTNGAFNKPVNGRPKFILLFAIFTWLTSRLQFVSKNQDLPNLSKTTKPIFPHRQMHRCWHTHNIFSQTQHPPWLAMARRDGNSSVVLNNVAMIWDPGW